MKQRIKNLSWTKVAACLVLLFSISTRGQQAGREEPALGLQGDSASRAVMSVEEKLVRFAYKKLEVYNAASSYYDRPDMKEIAERGKSIKFDLTNFKVGRIEDISRHLYRDLVSLPNEEVIQLVSQTIQLNDEEPRVGYRARWAPGQYATFFDRNWTLGEILKMESEKYYDVARYVSYDVTVSLDKRSRSYSALVLFHGPVENFRLEFWDVVVGMGGTISGVWSEQRIPHGLKRGPDANSVGVNSHKNFIAKIRTYLADRGSTPIYSSQPIKCGVGVKSITECCLDSDLAKFWDIDACNGWQKDLPTSRDDGDGDLEPQDIQFYSSDDTGHISGTGVHHGRARFRPSCTEVSSTRQRCNVEIRDQGYGDSESNHSDIYYHRGATAETSRGSEGPRGQNIECDAAIGFAFDYCIFPSCNVSITLSVSGHGTGASATVTGGTLWQTARAQGNVCNIPVSTSPGGCNQPSTYGCLPGFASVNGICTRSDAFMTQCFRFGDYDFDACACTGGCEGGSCSPIVVDVLGNGFSMSNASTGVFFDMEGQGTAGQFSWTAENSDDAWLALDRNNNGLIDSGKELFGNITAQDIHAEGVERNGFLALALYDSAGYGGNGDGLITQQDTIFSRLKLWRDENHNGVSETCELFTLPELGLEKIDLNYRSSRRADEHGNEFRYRSKVHDSRDSNIGRWAWDVFLVRQP